MSAASEWKRFGYLPFAAAFGYSISVLHVYSMGPFIAPLQADFAWSRTQVSMGITIANVVNAMLCIPMGMLIDRIGPRRIGLAGTLLIAAAYALLGSASGTTPNWVALWAVVAIGVSLVQSTVWTSAVATRFAYSRGLAFAVTLSGASVGAAVFPLLAAWLIGLYGWRTAFVATGGIWAVLVFPILLLLFRSGRDRRPDQDKAEPSAAPLIPGLSLSEGLRLAAFYKLLLAGGLFAFTVIGVAVHFVPILTDRGAATIAAAGAASLIGIFSIVGRLGTGVMLDRFPGHLVGAGVFLLAIVACALLLYDGSRTASQLCAAAIFGLTLGAEVDVIAFLATQHFGLRNYGSLFGGLVAALALGAAFGPLAAGATFDRYGSYAMFLAVAMILMATSSVAIASLGKPRLISAVAPGR